jgi:hypothetical protein
MPLNISDKPHAGKNSGAAAGHGADGHEPADNHFVAEILTRGPDGWFVETTMRRAAPGQVAPTHAQQWARINAALAASKADDEPLILRFPSQEAAR